MTDAVARVEALLAAARRAFGEARDPSIVGELAAESGLHPANVAFALDELLELEPDPRELAELHARATPRSEVLVVLAGNVFIAPLRAIAWALASAPRVVVRTSRRAARFPRLLVERAGIEGLALLPLGDDPATDVAAAAGELAEGAAIHAYGGRATIDAIDAIAEARGLARELHGPGLGVVVGASPAIVSAADAIARDVAAFDQRGCLSPRLVLAVGDADDAASALHRALDRLDRTLPRGHLDDDERGAIARARDAAIFAGAALSGDGHLVTLGVAEPGPVGRVLPVARASDADEVVDRLRALGDGVAIVATEPAFDSAVRDAVPGRRVVPLGRMQRPPFDGPVDLRPLRRA